MIRQYTISPPLTPLPGDTFAVVAGVLEQRRNGGLVAFRTLAAMASAPMTGPQFVGDTITKFFLEEGMSVSVTINSVQLPATGPILVNYADTQVEYANRAALIAAIEDVAGAAWARKALLAHWYAQNPALDDPSFVNGRTLQIDLGLVLNPLSIGMVQ